MEGSLKSSLWNKKVNVYGYPIDRDTQFISYGDPPFGIPTIDFDSVTSVNPRALMRYRGDVTDGFSDGPIWAVDRTTKKRYLVADPRGLRHCEEEPGRDAYASRGGPDRPVGSEVVVVVDLVRGFSSVISSKSPQNKVGAIP